MLRQLGRGAVRRLGRSVRGVVRMGQAGDQSRSSCVRRGRTVGARRRAYAEWYAWARREIGGDAERLHAAARAALNRLETGGDSLEATRAARHAVGEPEPAPPQPTGIIRLDEALSMTGPGMQG